jgi:serine/threonine-protein kinase HipA
MQEAKVYRNNQEIGLLQKDDAALYYFQYNTNYLLQEDALSISVHFPLRKEPFHAAVLFPFFFNLLAEGAIKEMQCQELKIDPDDHFTRLLKTTESNTIGSITLKEITHEMP